MNGSYVRAAGACLLALASFAVPAWAQEASDLTLRRAVDAALKHNPELQSTSFSLLAQQARVRQAELRPAPEAAIDLENAFGSGELRGTQAAEYTFALSQVLELGGKRAARVAAAQAELDTLAVDRQARQLDVLAEVTRRFIAVAARQEQLKLAGRAVELAGQTVADLERRVSAAKSPHAELDRARIALDRARLDARAATVDLDTARKQLAATWGESEPLIDGSAMGDVRAELFDLPTVVDYATLQGRLNANPDFLRLASEARLRDAEVRLATTLRRPDLTVGGGVRRFEESGDQAFVASISMPLFGARRAESFAAEARANREKFDAEMRAVSVKSQAALYELYRQLGRAVSEATSLRADILPRTEEAARETKYAYERGRFSYLEMMDAQREYLAVQSSLIEAATTAHLLQVDIERLTNAPLTN